MALELASEAPPLRVIEGGEVRVGTTRVPLDTVVNAFLEGNSPEAIVEAFDTLCLADVYAVVAYYLRYRREVDAYLHARRAQTDEFRRRAQSGPDYQLWRERLLARGKAAGLRP